MPKYGPLKKIALANWMCHRTLEIDLHPGVNVIAGKSGRGKSAILRALRWNAFNDTDCPGDSYRTWGTHETWAAVWYEYDGKVASICRRRSNRDNDYALNWDSDAQEELDLWERVGTTVPDTIRGIVNLGEINFQTQFDPLFLLSLNPAAVGRVLNELVGFDLIDESFSRIESRLRGERSTRDTSKAQQERIERELERFKDLPEFTRDLMEIEQLEVESNWRSARFSSIMDLVNKAKGLDGELARRNLKGVPKALKELEAIEALDSDLTELRADITGLVNLLNDHALKVRDLQRVEDDLSNAKERFNKLKPPECPLCGKEW